MESFFEALLKSDKSYKSNDNSIDELIETFCDKDSTQNVLHEIPIKNNKEKSQTKKEVTGKSECKGDFTIDLNRGLITDGLYHYTIVNDLIISKGSNEKHRVLVLPQFQYGNAKEFIESVDLFKDYKGDKVTKNLYHCNVALTQIDNRYFITKLIINDKFEPYYKYSFISMLGQNKKRDELLDLLKCEFAVVAQPYFTFEIKYEIEETFDRHYYIINDKKTFDFLYNNDKSETLQIIKEFVRLDENYLVNSAIKGKFVTICVTNHDKSKSIYNI